MFGRSTSKNYIAKDGYLVPAGGGQLQAGTLYIYNNGTCIIKMHYTDFVYEATPTSRAETDSVFNINSNPRVHEKFIVTE